MDEQTPVAPEVVSETVVEAVEVPVVEETPATEPTVAEVAPETPADGEVSTQ